MPVWCAALLTLVAAAFAVGCYVRAGNEATSRHATAWSPYGPNLERWGAYTGLILGLGLSIKNGLKGCANIYLGNESYWNDVFMNITGPLMILGMAAVSAWILLRPGTADPQNDPFPHACGMIWLVLLVQNILAQLVTGPLLFVITAVIIYHYHFLKRISQTL
jgi:hypothetical protein